MIVHGLSSIRCNRDQKSQGTKVNKQKHWQLSLEYPKWDDDLDFQDDHNKEYMVDGGFAQDNEILLAFVVVRAPVLFQSEMENSKNLCFSGPPRSERLRTNSRSPSCKLDHISSIHHLLT